MIGIVFAAMLAQADGKPAEKAAQMTEDVEVMRRLLNKALGVPNEAEGPNANVFDGYLLNTATGAVVGRPNSAGSLNNPTQFQNQFDAWPSGVNATMPRYFAAYDIAGLHRVRAADPFDGVYLHGHGIVYTLRVRTGEQFSVGETKRSSSLVSTCNHCHSVVPADPAKLAPAGGDPAKLSDWERARNDVLGKKTADAEPKSQTVEISALCKPGSLTEAVIEVLAKNGKHLRHLPTLENVTVVVTLDGLYGPARSAADGQPAGKIGFTPDESKLIAVGDLHAKNGKFKDAAAAYAKALARFPNAELTIPQQPVTAAVADKMRDEVRQAYVAVRRKLAAALLNIDDDPAALDAARKALELATATKVSFVTTEAKAVSVPAKLVVSVRKVELDGVDGVPAESFRKQVRVTTTGFPPADKTK